MEKKSKLKLLIDTDIYLSFGISLTWTDFLAGKCSSFLLHKPSFPPANPRIIQLRLEGHFGGLQPALLLTTAPMSTGSCPAELWPSTRMIFQNVFVLFFHHSTTHLINVSPYIWQEEITMHPYLLHLRDESLSHFPVNKLDPVVYSLLSHEEYPDFAIFQKPNPAQSTHFVLFSLLAWLAKHGLFLMAYLLQLANNALWTTLRND